MNRESTTRSSLFSPWFDDAECSDPAVRVLVEKVGGRDEVLNALIGVAADHLVGLKVIEKLGGFSKSVEVLKNRLPQGKISRSGMLGEILATEFLEHETEFAVPVKRLRYRDTRELAMRGDDVLGVSVSKTRIRVMKVEAKSRVTLSNATILEARVGLEKHRGRPNPETLAFLDCILRREDRDAEAEIFTQLQKKTIRAGDVCHLLFTVSGNNPSRFLENNTGVVQKGIDFRLCGCQVDEHAEFIKMVFEGCLLGGAPDGAA